MGRQRFAPKETVVGRDVLWEIPKNHLVGSSCLLEHMQQKQTSFYCDNAKLK